MAINTSKYKREPVELPPPKDETDLHEMISSAKPIIEFLIGTTQNSSWTNANDFSHCSHSHSWKVVHSSTIMHNFKMFYRDENLRTSSVDVPLTEKQYDALCTVAKGARCIVPVSANGQMQINHLRLIVKRAIDHVSECSGRYNGAGAVKWYRYEGVPIYREDPATLKRVGVPHYEVDINGSVVRMTKDQFDVLRALDTMPLPQQDMTEEQRMSGLVRVGPYIPPVVHTISVEEIPATLLPYSFPDENNGKRAKEERTYALKCSCNKNLFCTEIVEKIRAKNDFQIWKRFLPAADTEKYARFVIPIYGLILYSFRLKVENISDWQGNKSQFAMIHGIHLDDTHLVQLPEGGSQILSSQFHLVAQWNENENSDTRERVNKAIQQGIPVPCQSTHHNYGTNMRIEKTLQEAKRDQQTLTIVASALAMTIGLYGYCTPCYQNHVAAFSLIVNPNN